MSLSDPLVQQQYCESHIKCPICACKWVHCMTCKPGGRKALIGRAIKSVSCMHIKGLGVPLWSVLMASDC